MERQTQICKRGVVGTSGYKRYRPQQILQSPQYVC